MSADMRESNAEALRDACSDLELLCTVLRCKPVSPVPSAKQADLNRFTTALLRCGSNTRVHATIA